MDNVTLILNVALLNSTANSGALPAGVLGINQCVVCGFSRTRKRLANREDNK